MSSTELTLTREQLERQAKAFRNLVEEKYPDLEPEKKRAVVAHSLREWMRRVQESGPPKKAPTQKMVEKTGYSPAGVPETTMVPVSPEEYERQKKFAAGAEKGAGVMGFLGNTLKSFVYPEEALVKAFFPGITREQMDKLTKMNPIARFQIGIRRQLIGELKLVGKKATDVTESIDKALFEPFHGHGLIKIRPEYMGVVPFAASKLATGESFLSPSIKETEMSAGFWSQLGVNTRVNPKTGRIETSGIDPSTLVTTENIIAAGGLGAGWGMTRYGFAALSPTMRAAAKRSAIAALRAAGPTKAKGPVGFLAPVTRSVGRSTSWQRKAVHNIYRELAAGKHGIETYDDIAKALGDDVVGDVPFIEAVKIPELEEAVSRARRLAGESATSQEVHQRVADAWKVVDKLRRQARKRRVAEGAEVQERYLRDLRADMREQFSPGLSGIEGPGTKVNMQAGRIRKTLNASVSKTNLKPRLVQVEEEFAAGASARKVGNKYYIEDRMVTKTEYDYFKHVEKSVEKDSELAKAVTGKYISAREAKGPETPVAEVSATEVPRKARERKPEVKTKEYTEADDLALFGKGPESKVLYRDILEFFTGKRSTTDMTFEEANALIHELVGMGADEAYKLIEVPPGAGLKWWTPLDWFRDTSLTMYRKGGDAGKSLVNFTGHQMVHYLYANDALSKQLNILLKGVRRGSKESRYIAGVLDGRATEQWMIQLKNSLSKDKLITLDAKSAQLRALFDDTFSKINKMRSNYGIDPMSYREHYLTHLFTDPIVGNMGVKGHVSDRLGKEVFFRFSQIRKGAKEYKMDAIDVVNSYFPAALAHYYFTPIQSKWVSTWRPAMEKAALVHGKSPAKNLISAAEEWLRYLSGKGGKIDGAIEGSLYNVLEPLAGIKGLGAVPYIRRGVSETTQYIYFATLGANLASPIVNATQMLNALWATHPSSFLKALGAMFTHRKGVDKIFKKLGINIDPKSIFGLRGKRMLKEVGTETGRFFRGKPSLVTQAKEKVVRRSLSAFELAEIVNRRVSVLSAIFEEMRLAKKAGKAFDRVAAVNRARHVLRWTQFDFSPMGQLPVLRGWATRGLLQYARFPIQQMQFYMDKVWDTSRGVAKAGKAAALGDFRAVYANLSPAAKMGVYMAAFQGTVMLARQLGLHFLSRAAPDWVLAPGRELMKVFGVSESESLKLLPKGESATQVLPGIGPGVSEVKDWFTGDRLGHFTEESVLIPGFYKKFAKAEDYRKKGILEDARGNFIQAATEEEDLSSIATAIATSPAYRQLLISGSTEQYKLQLDTLGIGHDIDYEAKKLKSNYLDEWLILANDNKISKLQESMEEGLRRVIEHGGVELKLWKHWGELHKDRRRREKETGKTMSGRAMATWSVALRRAWKAVYGEAAAKAALGE